MGLPVRPLLALGAAAALLLAGGLGLRALPKGADGCGACHGMRGALASWKASRHAKVAACRDCHLPSGLAGPLVQILDGTRHAVVEGVGSGFRARHLGPTGAAVVQANCRRCHPPGPASATRPGALPPLPADALHADPERPCAPCHRETPHARGSAQPVRPRGFGLNPPILLT